MREATYDLLVMSDSDIRVDAAMLGAVAAEFQNPKLGVTTCPYRAVAGEGFWTRLEAIGMNTQFLGGVLTARMLEGGIRFGLGSTLALSREALVAIGGLLAYRLL